MCNCAYVGFLKYSLQVVDYAKLVQPRFDKALDTLIKNTIAEATEEAIKTVKDRLLLKAENKNQGDLSFLNVFFKLGLTIKPGCLPARTWFAHLDISGTLHLNKWLNK